MENQMSSKVGSACIILGSIVAVVLNVIHPRIPEFGNMRALLLMIASTPLWSALHVGLCMIVMVVLIGLVTFSRTFDGTPGEEWAQRALLSATVATTLFIAVVAVDGYGLKAMAEAWSSASASDQPMILQVTRAVDVIGTGLSSLWVIVNFGFAPVLYGVAILASEIYPKGLGWVAVVGGIAAAATGIIDGLNGPSNLVTNTLFPIVSAILTIWLLVMGVILWQRAANWSQ